MKIYKFACVLSIVGLIICICTQSTCKTNNTTSNDITKKSYPTVSTVLQEQWISLGEFRITFYCPCEKCCGKWSGMGITATGEPIEFNRTIAVDPQ